MKIAYYRAFYPDDRSTFFPHPRVYSRSNETQPTKRVSDLTSDLISRETRAWSCTECGKIDFQSWKNRRARDTFVERANGISRIASEKQRASIVEKKDFTRIIKARNVRKKKENEGEKRKRKEKKNERTNERTKMCPIDADVSRNGKSRTTAIVVERDNSKLPGDTRCIEDAREERIQTLRPIDGNAFVRPRTASNFRRENDFRYRDISNIRVLYNRTYDFRGQKVASALSRSNTVARESDQALTTEHFYRYVTCVLTVTSENPRTCYEKLRVVRSSAEIVTYRCSERSTVRIL